MPKQSKKQLTSTDRLTVLIASKRGDDVFAGLDDEVKDIMSINLEAIIETTPNKEISKTLLELMTALRDLQIVTTELRRREFEEAERILSDRGYQIRYLSEGGTDDDE